MASRNEASICDFVGTNSHEKHTAEPMQFGMAPALLSFSHHCFCILNGLKRFGGTIREM